MEKEPREERRPSCLDQFHRDDDRARAALKKENIQLRKLVVRLSEMVIRTVTRKK